jgi:hypothetical protein
MSAHALNRSRSSAQTLNPQALKRSSAQALKRSSAQALKYKMFGDLIVLLSTSGRRI